MTNQTVLDVLSDVEFSHHDKTKCGLYNKSSTDDKIFHLANPYGGLPQNLLINLIGWIICMLIFLFLRNKAWKLVKNQDGRSEANQKLSSNFFSFIDNNHGETSSDNSCNEFSEREVAETDDRVQNSAPMSPGVDEIRFSHEFENEMLNGCESRWVESCASSICGGPESGNTFLDWLKSIFTISDTLIEAKIGTDAMQFLRFQRYLIGYLTIVFICSISIILPLNFQGDLQGTVASFGHTTLANLSPDSYFLWIHVIIAFLLFPLAIIAMKLFSVDLRFQEECLDITHTIQIGHISRNLCIKSNIKAHFDQTFPQCRIKDIKIAFNVSKLMETDAKLRAAITARKYCQSHMDLVVYPVSCSRYCGCFCACFCNQQKGVDYYTNLEAKLTEDFIAQKEDALNSPLGIAFITFEEINSALRVYRAHRKSWSKCYFRDPPESSVFPLRKVKDWSVSFAPHSDDIYWSNLSIYGRHLRLRKILLNLALISIALFLTTPEYLVSQANIALSYFGTTYSLPSIVLTFAPTILLWGFTALMPLLVSQGDRFLGHHSRSAENYIIMKKTFLYLLFLVVILPTFGFTTAQAVYYSIFVNNELDRMECVFLPDSGAFFVNYVITAALIGTGFELIRLPDLMWHIFIACGSVSKADQASIYDVTKFEFRFGEQYARIMMMFCMVIVFSISCPLIAPFGLLYFIMKHFVDRHNLLYAYKASKINKKVHSLAINYVIFSTVLLQIFMTIFSVIRSGGLQNLTYLSKLSICLMVVSLVIFCAQTWSAMCRKFSAVVTLEHPILPDTGNETSQTAIYLPKVLQGHAGLHRKKKVELTSPPPPPQTSSYYGSV